MNGEYGFGQPLRRSTAQTDVMLGGQSLSPSAELLLNSKTPTEFGGFTLPARAPRTGDPLGDLRTLADSCRTTMPDLATTLYAFGNDVGPILNNG